MDEPRLYTSEHPDEGRLDTDGIEWFACDPYPTWYRWWAGELILPALGIQWQN